MNDINIEISQNSGSDCSSANNGDASSNEKIEVKFSNWFGVLSIVFMLLIIAGIICSVIFIKNIYEPSDNSSSPVNYIQYTISLAFTLTAVIIASLSLIKLSKWLIKVDLIKQLLNASCSTNDRELIKKFCDTLAEL